MRMVFLVLGAVLCVVGMTGFPRANENEQAGRTVRQTTGSDGAILFANGTIYINTDKKAHNLLVKDGSVAGWNVRAEEHPSATTIDLKGASAYPGFIDSHCHLMEAGTVLEVGADLASCAVLDALDKVHAEKGRIKGIHTLIHLAFPTDEQVERIKKFDGHVVTTVQPGF